MRRGTHASFALLLAFWALAREANAQSDVRTFSLTSPSAASCPAVASFPWRVEARTARARLAAPKTADLDFVLSVQTDVSGASGRLEIHTHGETQLRDVRGASCDEVVDALALIAAMLLDPNASTQPTPTAPVEAATPAAAPPAAPRAEAPPSTAAVPAVSRRAPAPATTEPWRIVGGVRAVLSGGVAPDTVIGPGVFVGVLHDTRDSLLEPMLRVGFTTATSDTMTIRGFGDAQFEWWALDLQACPLRLPARGALAARPCAAFESGRLTGKGSRTNNPAEDSTLWLAASAIARLEWALFDVLRLELDAGVVLPLTREGFYFAPAETVHEVPAVATRGALGLAAVLP